MANGGIIGPTNDPISLTVSAPGTAVNFTSSGTFTPFSAKNFALKNTSITPP